MRCAGSSVRVCIGVALLLASAPASLRSESGQVPGAQSSLDLVPPSSGGVGSTARLGPEPGRLAIDEAALATAPTSRELLLDAAAEALAVAIMTEAREERRELARRSQDFAERGIASDSSSFEARYLRAAAMGVRMETEGTTARIRLGRDMSEAVLALLDANPTHAGAHHLQGRLNAGVMRLGTVTRFLARQLIGGETVDRASWAVAEHHMSLAVELNPDELLHHVELGLLYRDTGRVDLAVATWEAVLERSAATPLDRWQAQRAKTLLADLR